MLLIMPRIKRSAARSDVALSGVAPGFAPEAELFLHNAIRKAEQYRLGVGAVGVLAPARHNEDVMRLPGKDLVADSSLPAALDDDEYGTVGRAVGLAVEARRQQLNESGDGRHRELAASRVDVAQLVAVIRVGRAVPGERVKRLAGADIGIIEYRRGLDVRLPVDRQQVVAEPGEAVALRAADRLGLVGIALGKAGAQQLDDLDVEPVEPHHRLLGLLSLGGLPPAPGGGASAAAARARAGP